MACRCLCCDQPGCSAKRVALSTASSAPGFHGFLAFLVALLTDMRVCDPRFCFVVFFRQDFIL